MNTIKAYVESCNGGHTMLKERIQSLSKIFFTNDRSSTCLSYRILRLLQPKLQQACTIEPSQKDSVELHNHGWNKPYLTQKSYESHNDADIFQLFVFTFTHGFFCSSNTVQVTHCNTTYRDATHKYMYPCRACTQKQTKCGHTEDTWACRIPPHRLNPGAGSEDWSEMRYLVTKMIRNKWIRIIAYDV